MKVMLCVIFDTAPQLGLTRKVSRPARGLATMLGRARELTLQRPPDLPALPRGWNCWDASSTDDDHHHAWKFQRNIVPLREIMLLPENEVKTRLYPQPRTCH